MPSSEAYLCCKPTERLCISLLAAVLSRPEATPEVEQLFRSEEEFLSAFVHLQAFLHLCFTDPLVDCQVGPGHYIITFFRLIC